jgi:hypothetical protein
VGAAVVVVAEAAAAVRCGVVVVALTSPVAKRRRRRCCYCSCAHTHSQRRYSPCPHCPHCPHPTSPYLTHHNCYLNVRLSMGGTTIWPWHWPTTCSKQATPTAKPKTKTRASGAWLSAASPFYAPCLHIHMPSSVCSTTLPFEGPTTTGAFTRVVVIMLQRVVSLRAVLVSKAYLLGR